MTMPMDSSLGSLSSPRRSKAASEISRTYKNARDLFLQRRLAEAFNSLKPLVTEESSDETSQDGTGHLKKRAPIANVSRSSRIKVWSLYITLLNAIAELDLEEGKDAVGSKEWKILTKKMQDGTIWDEVVNIGYGGMDGNVDADIVINLANLLLAQSPSQETTQQHLELYLSTSSAPPIDQFATQINLKEHANGHSSHRSGTDTPQDLESRVQIIELYALHVLPRNSEWEYAREFVNMSEILDEERRESFLQTLSNLEDEAKGISRLREIEPMHEAEKVTDIPLLDAASSDSASTVREAQPRSGDLDRGVKPTQSKTIKEASNLKPKSSSSATTRATTSTSPAPPKPLRKPSNSSYPSRLSRPPGHITPHKAAQSGLYKRSVTMLATIQHVISNLGHHLSQNPMMLLRFVLFLAGLVAALSRRDVKDRLAVGWNKVKRTVGMGVKVSYI